MQPTTWRIVTYLYLALLLVGPQILYLVLGTHETYGARWVMSGFYLGYTLLFFLDQRKSKAEGGTGSPDEPTIRLSLGTVIEVVYFSFTAFIAVLLGYATYLTLFTTQLRGADNIGFGLFTILLVMVWMGVSLVAIPLGFYKLELEEGNGTPGRHRLLKQVVYILLCLVWIFFLWFR